MEAGKDHKIISSLGAVIVMQHISKRDNDLFQGLKGSRMNNPIVKNQKEVFKSNIYISGLPIEVTEDALKQEFGKCGEIVSVKIKAHYVNTNGVNDKISQSGYVLYKDVGNAQRAILKFDDSNPWGKGKHIRVDFWRAKEDLKLEKEERMSNQLTQMVNLVIKQNNSERVQN